MNASLATAGGVGDGRGELQERDEVLVSPSPHEWACADRDGERYKDAVGQSDAFQTSESKNPAHYLEPGGLPPALCTR